MKSLTEKYIDNAKRIIVKIGSGVLTEDNGLNKKVIKSISTQINKISSESCKEIILVSSGAQACGVKKVGLKKRPSQIPERQAVSAIGQAGLILEYEKAFAKYDKNVAQVLLTSDDLSSRKRYLNARNTLNTLLSWKILPIINENDTVVTDEIKFGDNDNLSAMIALLLDADLLVNLTDIEGVYTKDPRVHSDAELISQVKTISKNIEKNAGETPGALGTGGMLSKIKAAKKVNSAGIPMIIAMGTKKDILLDIINGKEPGTFFIPKKDRLASRKCWIAFNLKPQGRVMLDSGAEKAIIKNGKSILAIGITEVEGEFGIGAAVEFVGSEKKILGVGLVNYSSKDIRNIKRLSSSQIKDRLGYKPYDEVIHRDNMAVTV
ncbi:MAG: glutamate 5-kinase [Deltaproteobacteria bacterium]|nr:glutamate 5-kinase [Deltaproteobacteria bacterium]